MMIATMSNAAISEGAHVHSGEPFYEFGHAANMRPDSPLIQCVSMVLQGDRIKRSKVAII
jgi:hypothetical protein